MTETIVNSQDNPSAEGKVEGTQGQSKETQATSASQPQVVELPGGEKVTLEELKLGYMKDKDYRQKTAAVAEKERQLEIERQRSERRGVFSEEETSEEVNPIVVLNERLSRVEALYARDYLKSEIDRLASDYPDADKKIVFDACWNNPNAIIKDEMARSHEVINERVSKKATDIDSILKAHPELDKQLEEKYKAKYLASKTLKTEAVTGTGAATSQTVVEDDEGKPVDTYKQAGSNLRKNLEAQGD